jgi:hypothetical protein
MLLDLRSLAEQAAGGSITGTGSSTAPVGLQASVGVERFIGTGDAAAPVGLHAGAGLERFIGTADATAQTGLQEGVGTVAATGITGVGASTAPVGLQEGLGAVAVLVSTSGGSAWNPTRAAYEAYWGPRRRIAGAAVMVAPHGTMVGAGWQDEGARWRADEEALWLLGVLDDDEVLA